MRNISMFEDVKDPRLTFAYAASWTLQILLGSLFLALMAQLSIYLPISPVPITMQTFGIAILAITLGSQKAPWAVACYLAEASMGFPVLAGGAVNPIWMLGPRAGYLIGFLFSAYMIAKLIESQKRPNFFSNWLCIIAGDASLMALGWLWFSYFVGFGNAFTMGVLPFIPGALMKSFLAATSIKPLSWLKTN